MEALPASKTAGRTRSPKRAWPQGQLLADVAPGGPLKKGGFGDAEVEETAQAEPRRWSHQPVTEFGCGRACGEKGKRVRGFPRQGMSVT